MSELHSRGWMLRVSMLILIFVAVSAGCAPKGITVKTETTTSAILTQAKTYTWEDPKSVLVDEKSIWAPPGFDLKSELKFLIDRELRDYGLSEAPKDGDISVEMTIYIDMDAMDVIFKKRGEESVMHNLPQGSIVIVLTDKDTKEALWTGTAEYHAIGKQDDDEVKKRLRYVVTKMFSDLP